MSYTELLDIINWLKSLEETSLVELLDITSSDLVDAFSDKIIENQAKFIRAYVTTHTNENDIS